MELSVIPECYVDTNLVETLVPPKKKYNHQKGCGTVTKVMKEKFANSFAVGVIDKDKNEVDYLKEFDVISDRGSLILHKHKTKHHYIIQLSPAIESFILHNASNSKISLEDFGLYSDLKLLTKESKTITSKNDVRFKRLFKELHKKGASDFLRLAAWVDYLKSNNYNVNIDNLKVI